MSLLTTLLIFFKRLCHNCSFIEALWSLSCHCPCGAHPYLNCALVLTIFIVPLRSSSSLLRCCAHLYLCAVALIFIFAPLRSSSFSSLLYCAPLSLLRHALISSLGCRALHLHCSVKAPPPKPGDETNIGGGEDDHCNRGYKDQ